MYMSTQQLFCLLCIIAIFFVYYSGGRRSGLSRSPPSLSNSGYNNSPRSPLTPTRDEQRSLTSPSLRSGGVGHVTARERLKREERLPGSRTSAAQSPAVDRESDNGDSLFDEGEQGLTVDDLQRKRNELLSQLQVRIIFSMRLC